MLRKAIAFILAFQFAIVLAVPATTREEIVTTVIDGNRNMRDLLDELSYTGPGGIPVNTGNNVVKKTTTTTTTTTSTGGGSNVLLNDEDQLQQYLKDPELAKELMDFLMEFVKIFNMMNRGSNIKITKVTQEDAQKLLHDEAFVNFLNNFFQSSTQKSDGSDVASFVSHFVQQPHTSSSSTTYGSTTSTVSGSTGGGVVDVSGHPADTLINSMGTNVVTSSVGESGNVVNNFPSRFDDGGNAVKVSKVTTSTYETSTNNYGSAGVPVATSYVGTTNYGNTGANTFESTGTYETSTKTTNYGTSGTNYVPSGTNYVPSGTNYVTSGTNYGTAGGNVGSNKYGSTSEYRYESTSGVNRQPSISSSEAILNELKEQATGDRYVTNTGSTSYTSNVNNAFGDVVVTRPATVVTRPATGVYGTTTSTWSNTGYEKLSEEELRQQAKNAKYQFATQIDDSIAGNFQQRAEIRENGVVYGKYSYDDGFYFRQTYYEADEHGFRITKEEVLPTRIKTLTGEASVQTLVNGNMVSDYHITKNDIQHTVSHNNNMGLIH